MGPASILTLLALGAILPDADPGEPPRPRAEAGATVTVTAEATPVDREKTPNPVKILDAEALQRLPVRSLADLLGWVLPGQVLAFGGPGALANLKLNGSRDQDTVILLDGIRINDASGLGLDLSRIGLEGIERVEILTGPASARYGADAHGGVVALYSSGSAAPGLSGSVSAALGSQGQARLQANPALGWATGWVRLGLQTGREAFPTEAARPARQVGGSLGLGQHLGPDALLTLQYRNRYMAAPVPFVWGYDPLTWAPARAYDAERNYSARSEHLVGALRWVLGGTLVAELDLGHVLDDRWEPPYMAGPQDRFTARRSQATARLQWTPRPQAGATLALEGSEAQATRGTGGDASRAASRHLSAALEGHWEPLAPLRLVASLRRQEDRLGALGTGGRTETERAIGQTTYKLGANLRLREGLRAYASYGTAFNNPQLYQVLTNRALGRPELDNEQSASLQLGVDGRWGPWTAHLEAFRTRFENVVAYTGNWPDGHFLNAGHLRLQGAEARVGYGTEVWGVEVQLRSQEGRNLDLPDGEQLRGSGAAGRPFAVWSTLAWWQGGALRLDLRWTRVGHGYYYVEDLGGVAANRTHYNDLALGATWRLGPDLSLSLRGEHLLQRALERAEWVQGLTAGRNDTYLIPDYPTQTRSLVLEARYRF